MLKFWFPFIVGEGDVKRESILAQALSSFLVLDIFWFVCWRIPLVGWSVRRRRRRRRRSNDSSVCGWYSDGGQRWQTVIGDVTPRVSGIADTSLRASLTDYHWRSGPRAGSLNPATPLDPQTLENEYSWVLNVHSTDSICFWFRNSILVRINNSNRLWKCLLCFKVCLISFSLYIPGSRTLYSTTKKGKNNCGKIGSEFYF